VRLRDDRVELRRRGRQAWENPLMAVPGVEGTVMRCSLDSPRGGGTAARLELPVGR
jgi:hypothetical protein